MLVPPSSIVPEPTRRLRHRMLRILGSRSVFGLLTSFVAHTVCLIVLAVIAFPEQTSRGALTFLASVGLSVDEETPIEFTEFTVSNAPDIESGAPQGSGEALSLSGLSEVDLTELEDRILNDIGSPSGSHSGRVVHALATSTGKGKGGSGDADGFGASFFGIGAGGDKFVFILDSSRSMEGKRWSYAVMELIRSIKDLGPDQKYFVICFDFNSHPIFDLAPPHNEYITASSRMLVKVRSWLRAHKLGYETRPSSALQIAIDMKPDAIFLLSDGEIRDDSRARLMTINRDADQKPLIPIHTVHLFSQDGKEALEKIAEENGGTFREVK